MVEGLKPCPFCGGDKARTIHIRDGRKVACLCGACGKPEFHGPLDRPDAETRAIASWNARAAITQMEVMREALEFYADESGWNEPPVKTVHHELLGPAYQNQASKIRLDRGRRARAAIAPKEPQL